MNTPTLTDLACYLNPGDAVALRFNRLPAALPWSLWFTSDRTGERQAFVGRSVDECLDEMHKFLEERLQKSLAALHTDSETGGSKNG